MPDVQRELTEGEAWTREQLATLLAARFGPRAVARFVVASQARANAVRARRPDLGRQSRRWMAAGAGAYAVRATARGGRGAATARPGRGRAARGGAARGGAARGGAARGGAARGGARGGAAREAAAAGAWWTATAVMLDWHLGMVETPEGEPRPLSAADACTLLRAWLVPIVAADPAPLTCAVGGLSDVLDGRLARAGAPTRAGRDLEGLVDFCFAVAALRGLVRTGRLARGVVAAEVARTSAGFAYALYVYFGRAERPDDDLLHHARATTTVRFAGLVAAAAGRRRLGDALVAGGSAWSLAELSRAAGTRASSRGRAASP